jgi:hypothetical protein
LANIQIQIDENPPSYPNSPELPLNNLSKDFQETMTPPPKYDDWFKKDIFTQALRNK